MTWIVAAAIVLLVLLVFEFAAARIARSRYAPPGRLVDVGRRKLHVRTQGDAGPTVVFEAGAGSTSAAWTSVQREISTFARTLSYDRAGFGWSDPADGERTANALADDLHAVLTAPDVAPPYVLVAHSLGGAIITQYASNHPDTVAGYVYVDAAFAELYVRFGEAFPKWIRRIARPACSFEWSNPSGTSG